MIGCRNFRFCPLCRTGLISGLEESRTRLICPSCGWIHYLNPLPCSAAFVQNREGEVLLIKRGVEPAKGEWALPSGFIEIDESPEAACLRELWEETGLRGEIQALIGVYSQESIMYQSVIIIGYRVAASGVLEPGSDSLDAEYFPPDALPDVAFSTHREMIAAALSHHPEEESGEE